jgi:uncharacterized alkaline shock family protein YloU
MEMAEITGPSGMIRVSGQVVAFVASRAALDVPEIASLDKRFTNTISHAVGMDVVNGVQVSEGQSGAIISLYVVVKHGGRIPEITLKLQEHVKEVVETDIHIPVEAVHIYVQGIVFPKETKAGGSL